MKTSKPFSTISYNSIGFLQTRLDDLVKRQVICFYTFVYHYKEEDEKKDHIHLIIFPNGLYQTDGLSSYLSELDKNNLLGKPLGIMCCVSSKWDDWYLYASHDVAYLASKGQTRKYHYSESDFLSSDSDYLHELIHTIDYAKYAKTQDFVKKASNGVSLYDLVVSGQIPVPQFNQYKQLYDFVTSHTFRNGKTSHTPAYNVDEDGVVCNADTSFDDLL